MGKSLVLVFHKEENGPLFEKIIIALRKRYRLVSIQELEQLLANEKEIKNVCHISFDDGDRSFYHVVLPVLQKYKVPASLFLSPDVIAANTNYWFQEVEEYDEKKMKEILTEQLTISPQKINKIPVKLILKSMPYHEIEKVMGIYHQNAKYNRGGCKNISLEQLHEIVASGLVEIGGHSLKHPILKNESDSDCRNEITGSIRKLEALTGKPIKYFAFPNGLYGLDFGEREMNCLRDNNITMAFSSEIDTLSPHNNLLSIPRMSFDRMGLQPSNPLIFLRMNMGKKWTMLKSMMFRSERKMREEINRLLKK